MKCPFCGHNDSDVKDTRITEKGQALRRNRKCKQCGRRYTTFEHHADKAYNIIWRNEDENTEDSIEQVCLDCYNRLKKLHLIIADPSRREFLAIAQRTLRVLAGHIDPIEDKDDE